MVAAEPFLRAQREAFGEAKKISALRRHAAQRRMGRKGIRLLGMRLTA